MKHYLISIIIFAAAYLSMPGATYAQGENDTLWTKMIDGITDVKFSPDGKTVAAGRENGEIVFIDSQSGEYQYMLNHTEWIYQIDYSPDGQLLASCGGDTINGQVKVWDINTKQLKISLKDTVLPMRKSAVSICFSKDGKYLAASFLYMAITDPLTYKYVILIWDAKSFQLLKEIKNAGLSARRLLFSPDSKYLAVTSGEEAYTVHIYNTNTWEEMQILYPLHNDVIRGLKFSNDGSKLITGCDDGNIRIWNTEIKELERILKVEGNIKSMGISNDNNYIFYQWKYGLKSGLFKKDMKNEEIVYKYNTDVFPEGRTSMNSIDVSPNQPYFVAGSSVGLCVYKSDLLSSINETEQLIETIYPNPTNGMLKINFYNPIYQFLRVELQNISGALIDTIFSGNLEQGEQSINYNGNDIFAGNYIITISAKGFSKSFKFIKEK